MPYDLQIIGTVIASVLDYANLIKITKDPNVIDPTTSSWIPADGRSIAGSQLSKLTGQSNSPDLRGRFLRGLNEIYSVDQPIFDITSADSDDPNKNRKAGSYQQDSFTHHSHSINGSTLNCGTPPGYQVLNNTPGPTYTQSTSAVGGSETRPKNISVYYYIKIN